MRFTFDGKAIPAEPGQSIGAALIAAGHRSWRRTRIDAAPRGIFCGIGICHDCLVTVDGAANRRACLVEAAEDMRVTTQEGAGRAELEC
ncbi:(2Fe-2S)-binding protein [Labedaea rhizosphaerae]|uniref:2Fe-2S iron-sulfur cluster protein n=1 Tax=Labedaea rhizosphaerae TaxID=598644 RepID=A0A4R6RVK7_LABRH|nr:(2Fe-2S)-binding protein [Labedaea rhizosphaerae]TDP91039.1 2Fe-2S iron-sulfur cluster protein [Labedaea rhizosphaerae]